MRRRRRLAIDRETIRALATAELAAAAGGNTAECDLRTVSLCAALGCSGGCER